MVDAKGEISLYGSLERRKMPFRSRFQDLPWCSFRELIACGTKDATEQIVAHFQKKKAFLLKIFFVPQKSGVAMAPRYPGCVSPVIYVNIS